MNTIRILYIIVIFTIWLPQISEIHASEKQHLKANFTMTRSISALKDTVKSSGTLYLGGTGLLRWETNVPAKSVLIINGEKGWLHYPELGVTKTFDTSGDPVMKILSDHLVAFGNGNFSSLKELYNIHKGTDGSTRLTPKTTHVKKFFRELRVTAQTKGTISKVVLISANTDTTTIDFSNVISGAAFSKETFAPPSPK